MPTLLRDQPHATERYAAAMDCAPEDVLRAMDAVGSDEDAVHDFIIRERNERGAKLRRGDSPSAKGMP